MRSLFRVMANGGIITAEIAEIRGFGRIPHR